MPTDVCTLERNIAHAPGAFIALRHLVAAGRVSIHARISLHADPHCDIARAYTELKECRLERHPDSVALWIGTLVVVLDPDQADEELSNFLRAGGASS